MKSSSVFPNTRPWNDPPPVYKTLAFNKRRTRLYVMGWIVNQNDLKYRFNSPDSDIDDFVFFTLGGKWIQMGYRDRFGCVQLMYPKP
jgi:hypothetical protein